MGTALMQHCSQATLFSCNITTVPPIHAMPPLAGNKQLAVRIKVCDCSLAGIVEGQHIWKLLHLVSMLPLFNMCCVYLSCRQQAAVCAHQGPPWPCWALRWASSSAFRCNACGALAATWTPWPLPTTATWWWPGRCSPWSSWLVMVAVSCSLYRTFCVRVHVRQQYLARVDTCAIMRHHA